MLRIFVLSVILVTLIGLPAQAEDITNVDASNFLSIEEYYGPQPPANEEPTQGIPEHEIKQIATQASFIDALIIKSNIQAFDAIEKQVRLFSEKIKERFKLYLSRSGRYLGLMRSIVGQKGLPEELALLPLIESGFSTQAKSRAKAVGPWQFIESTARLYGLKINWWVDERRDPIKSTIAATEYLSNLYRMFGSWNLALAAYNAGEGKVLRALKKTKSDDFWDLHTTKHLKRETKEYVPKFIAAKFIADAPEKYGFNDLQYQEMFSYDEAIVPGGVPLEAVANAAGTTVDVIKDLNPELIRSCTPPDEKQYLIRIPSGSLAQFAADFLQPSKDCTYKPVTYMVKKGDTLSRIAQKTGVPAKTIMRINSLKKGSKLRPGQTLYLTAKNG